MRKFLEVRTSELEGAALDWAVAQVEGKAVSLAPPAYGNGWRVQKAWYPEDKYSPSNDWSQGGPLIEKHVQQLCDAVPPAGGWGNEPPMHYATANNASGYQCFEMGETKLVAACRAVVASVMGRTVSVPKELIV